jgi:hypothetical protein
MKRLLFAAALSIAGVGTAAAQSDTRPPSPSQSAQENLKAAACKGKGDGFYCVESGNGHHKINCTNEKVAALMPCPGGCVAATKECKQSKGALRPPMAVRPAMAAGPDARL